MGAQDYVIRQIEESDRSDHARQIDRAEERGDLEEVQIITDGFAR